MTAKTLAQLADVAAQLPDEEMDDFRERHASVMPLLHRLTHLSRQVISNGLMSSQACQTQEEFNERFYGDLLALDRRAQMQVNRALIRSMKYGGDV